MSITPHPTLEKFGFPDSAVRDYDHWVVVARPAQCTLGALVLINKGPEQAFAAIAPAAFQELHDVTRDIERGLMAFRPYDKINYLMLMMVDREVHFHVLPRYAGDHEFDGVTYADSGWPAAPDLGAGPTLGRDELSVLVDALKKAWPS